MKKIWFKTYLLLFMGFMGLGHSAWAQAPEPPPVPDGVAVPGMPPPDSLAAPAQPLAPKPGSPLSPERNHWMNIKRTFCTPGEPVALQGLPPAGFPFNETCIP